MVSTPAFAHAQCGQLIVPENRQKQNGKTISLLVVMIPSIAQPAKHDPVFYITGGPGGDAMGDVGSVVPTLNQDQDLIVLGQRGTVDATPALLCPEIDAFDTKAVSLVYDAPSTGVLHVAATKACHDRLVGRGSRSQRLQYAREHRGLRRSRQSPRRAQVEPLRNVLRDLRRARHDACASGEAGERDDRLRLAPQRRGPGMALEQRRRRVQEFVRCLRRGAFLRLEIRRCPEQVRGQGQRARGTSADGHEPLRGRRSAGSGRARWRRAGELARRGRPRDLRGGTFGDPGSLRTATRRRSSPTVPQGQTR